MIIYKVLQYNVLNKLPHRCLPTSFNLTQCISNHNCMQTHTRIKYPLFNRSDFKQKNTFQTPVHFGNNLPCSKSLSSLSFTKYTMGAAPASLKPYMKLIRWDKPIGSWLLFLPCTWSIFLAADHMHQIPDMKTLALFACGSILMRGAGCTINDMWDRKYDQCVERTRSRPLANGDLSYKQALIFLAGQLSISLCILMSFDWTTIMIGASSIVLVIIYPLMKRITYWPQLFLGLTLNFGILMSWQQIAGSIDPSCLTLYTSAALWTIIYDSVYSHQDKEDDLLIGVKSTALKFGDNSKLWLSGFSTVMCSGLLGTGLMCDQAWPYYAGVSIVSAHLAYQIYSTNLNKPEDCSKTFKSNRNLGILLWIAIIMSSAIKYKERQDKDSAPS